MAGLASLLRRNSKEVLALEGDHANKFLDLLKDLRERVTGRLAGLGGQSKPLDIFRLRQVLAETEEQIGGLEKRGGKLFDKALAESTDLAVTHLADEIESLSEAFDASPMVVSLDAAKVLANPNQQLLAEQFESSVERYGADLLNGVRRELFMGVRTGEPFSSIVGNIAGKRGPLGEVSEANADRLVRTELSESYNAAHVEGYKQAKKKIPDLVEVWVRIGSFECEVCRRLDGQQRPKSGYWVVTIGKKTRKIAHPPAHPHCACRLLSMRPEWKQGLEEAGHLEELNDE